MKVVYTSFLFGLTVALANSDILELEKTLEEATEIATITKVNVDYVPSVVSIMKGEQLKAIGANTLYEALGLLPGIQMQTNQIGETISIVRGFKNPNSSLTDKIKVMIDGVAVNSEIYGTAGFVMDLPIDIVDRIEVLRGPGSTIYGSGAFYGAVNVITKSSNGAKNGEFFVGGGSWFYKKIGGIANIQDKSTRYFVDGYYQGSQKKLLVDNSYTDAGSQYVFPRDYTTSEAFEDFSVGFGFQKENLLWNTRLKRSKHGNFYGVEERLEPRDDTGATNQFFSSEISYAGELFKGRFDIAAGLKDYMYEIDAIARDSSFGLGKYDGFDYDYSYRFKTAETTVYMDAIYKLPKLLKHNISAGVSASHTRVRENYSWFNLEDYAFTSQNPRLLGEPAMSYPYNNNMLEDGVTRSGVSVFFEDMYEVSQNVDFVVGARVEKQSDTKTMLNHRMGIVARWLGNSLITKLMHSTGHRTPSLAEKYALAHINSRAGEKSIKPESISSYEFAVIYKPSDEHKLSINAYYAQLNNVIDVEEFLATNMGYINYPKRVSKGVEIEYAYKPNMQHELRINSSFNKMSYQNTGNGVLQEMPDVSPIMYKGWYVFRPTNELSFGTTYQIYSKTSQNDDYGKDTTIPANHILNINARYKIFKDTELSFYLNNAQNKIVRMPSYYYRNYIGRNEGMIREGRNFMIELKQKF